MALGNAGVRHPALRVEVGRVGPAVLVGRTPLSRCTDLAWPTALVCPGRLGAEAAPVVAEPGFCAFVVGWRAGTLSGTPAGPDKDRGIPSGARKTAGGAKPPALGGPDAGPRGCVVDGPPVGSTPGGFVVSRRSDVAVAGRCACAGEPETVCDGDDGGAVSVVAWGVDGGRRYEPASPRTCFTSLGLGQAGADLAERAEGRDDVGPD